MQDKLKPIERRLKVLDEHIKQVEIYRFCGALSRAPASTKEQDKGA